MGQATMQLIHYGSDIYDPNLFEEISDEPFRNKAKGGLWTSPVDANYGWKEWCEAEDFRTIDKSFKVEFSGELLVINALSDLDELPWIESSGIHFITFQAICAGGFAYDAIYLTEKGEAETRYSSPLSLYGWDCECVFILNPKSVRGI